jgi:hypothetical protein
VTPKLVSVTLSGGPPASGCTSPTPAGAGPGTSTRNLPPSGTVTSQWDLPSEIVAGAKASIRLTIQQSAYANSGTVDFRAPAEFGLGPGPLELTAGTAPGQGYDQAKSFTFTPTRPFTAGERLFILVGVGCTGFTYEYVVS